jgi:hypothetical protein
MTASIHLVNKIQALQPVLKVTEGMERAGIATSYGLDGRNWSPGRGNNFFLLHSVQTTLGSAQS